MVDADLLRDLPEEIRQKLTGADLDLPEHTLDDLTPVANNTMARIDKFAKTFEDPAKFAELSLQRVDRLRRQVIDLTKDAKPGSTDSRALGAIIEHFDDWLLNAAGKGSIKQGPNVQGGRSASQVAAELKAGQQTYKEGSRISQPRGADLKEPGAKQVRSIADRRQHAEDTARLLKPNDRGELSPAALDTIERLKQVGGSSGDLDQVRGIVMDQLMTGDPGKVATRIDNFTRNNPTAAAHLFTPEQLQQMKDFGTTNRSLVPEAGSHQPVAIELPDRRRDRQAGGPRHPGAQHSDRAARRHRQRHPRLPRGQAGAQGGRSFRPRRRDGQGWRALRGACRSGQRQGVPVGDHRRSRRSARWREGDNHLGGQERLQGAAVERPRKDHRQEPGQAGGPLMASIQSRTDPRVAQPAMSLRDRLTGYMESATCQPTGGAKLLPEDGVKQDTLAKDLMAPLENAPGVGQGLAAEDLGQASQSGDKLDMAMAILGLMPGGGPEAKAGRQDSPGGIAAL